MHCKDAPRYVSRKFHKSLAKQFLEVAFRDCPQKGKTFRMCPLFVCVVLHLRYVHAGLYVSLIVMFTLEWWSAIADRGYRYRR